MRNSLHKKTSDSQAFMGWCDEWMICVCEVFMHMIHRQINVDRRDQNGDVWSYSNAQHYILRKPNSACQHQHLIPTVSIVVEAWGFQLDLQQQELPTSHSGWHELLCTPKYSTVKHEAICLTAKLHPKLSRATGQRSQTQKGLKRKETPDLHQPCVDSLFDTVGW